jgi:hypothetical protein
MSALEALLNLNPNNYWAVHNLAHEMRIRGRGPSAYSLVVRLVGLRPNHLPTIVAAAQEALFNSGIDAAHPYLARARALLVDSPGVLVEPGPALRTYVMAFPAAELCLQRRVKEAAAELGALEARSDIADEGDWAFWRLGSMRLALGQLRLAERTFSRIQDPAERAFAFASLSLAREDLPGIVASLRNYRGEDPAVTSMLVRASRLDDAERILRAIRAAGTLNEIAYGWSAEEIREARGDGARIKEALKRGAPWSRVTASTRAFLYSETLARAGAKAGDTAGAIRVLEETALLRDKLYSETGYTGYFWMRTQMLLADLYRKAGRQNDALAIENDLRAALGVADTDDPMLVKLRARSEVMPDKTGHE